MSNGITLPDLPAAPFSEVQALVRRLVTEGDWTAVPPLLDELYAQGRVEDRRELTKTISLLGAYITFSSVHPYSHMACKSNLEAIAAQFWLDLFDLNYVVGAITEKQKPTNQIAVNDYLITN